jgi:hypothetical protein
MPHLECLESFWILGSQVQQIGLDLAKKFGVERVNIRTGDPGKPPSGEVRRKPENLNP